MPDNTLQTLIAIGGQMQASLPFAVRQANKQLMTLNQSVLRVNQSIAGMGRRLVTGALSLAGMAGITQLARESVQLAEEETKIRMALTNTIINQNQARGIGVQQSKEQVDQLERQARVLQSQTGIYEGLTLKGDAYLAQFRLSAKTIQEITPAMSNLVTYQRLMGKSTEEAQESYVAIGRAIMGQSRGLKNVGVELTAQQQQLLKINYMMGNYAANARLIAREIQRQHGGAAAAFMRTLEGQSAAAQARIRSGMERIGEALLPLVQVGRIIISRFIDPLADKFKTLHDFVIRNWREWVAYIDRVVVPAFKKLVDQGWQYLIKALLWFKDNSGWLVPFLAKVAAGFVLWDRVIRPVVSIMWALVNPVNRVIVLIGGIGTAVYMAAKHFREFRAGSEQLQDWLFGTKYLDPKNQGYGAGVMRAFPKGVVPRAMPVQKGFLDEMITTVAKWMKNSLVPTIVEGIKRLDPIIDSWLQKTLKFVLDEVGKWLPKLDDLVDNAIQNIPIVKWFRGLLEQTVEGKYNYKLGAGDFTPVKPGQVVRGGVIPNDLAKPADDLNKSMGDLKKQTDKLTGNDFTHLNLTTDKLNDTFNDLITTLGNLNTGAAGGFGGGAGGTGGGAGGLAGANAGLAKAGPFPGAVRTMSEWVPGEARTRANQIGPMGNQLRLGDIAMSVDLMHQMHLKLGDYVDILDKNNKMILAHQHIMDTSWLRPGVPTHGIELWGRKDIGWSKVRPSTGGEEASTAKKPDVTINYNPTYHHTGALDEHRLADIHRRHIDQLKRDIAQAHYETNRSRFDGARSV